MTNIHILPFIIFSATFFLQLILMRRLNINLSRQIIIAVVILDFLCISLIGGLLFKIWNALRYCTDDYWWWFMEYRMYQEVIGIFILFCVWFVIKFFLIKKSKFWHRRLASWLILWNLLIIIADSYLTGGLQYALFPPPVKINNELSSRSCG